MKYVSVDWLQFPIVSHHVIEVNILIDGSTHSCVVVEEFLPRDLREKVVLHSAYAFIS